MTIDYNIVWVDDSPKWVASIETEIVDHISDLGFEAKIEKLESGDGFEEKCMSIDVDLIIVDFNLPDGRDGNVLISEIRDRGVFKEIVFYSQQGPPKELIGVQDGVFHSTREDALDTIKRVLELTVHKLQDLEVVRGLIIASTIDLEVKLEHLMIKAFRDQGQLFSDKVLDKHVYDFEKKVKFIISHLKDVIAAETNEERQAELKAINKKLNSFAKDVIDQRNILAHARKTTDEAGNAILKGINNRTKKIDFNRQWLSETRKSFREHYENLKQIEAVLS